MAFRIKKKFYNVFKLMKDISSVDQTVFEGEMTGTVKNELKRFCKNPRSFICLYDDKKIAGYLTYYAVTPAFAAAVRTDMDIHDDEIAPHDIMPWVKGKKHYVYILSIAMMPEYHGTEAMKLLGNAFSEEVSQLEREGYGFKEFSSTAISDGGERALSKFGLKYYKTINEGYKVYLCSGEEFVRK